MAGKAPLLPAEEDDWQGYEPEEVVTGRRGRVKSVLFIICAGLTYSVPALLMSQAPEPLPAPSIARLLIQGVLVIGMLTEIVADFNIPDSTKGQDSYKVIGLAGKPGYLTFWILSLQTAHVCYAAAAEAFLWMGAPAPRLLAWTYSASTFVATGGVALTLLFLKFCYFEEAWRRLEKDVWERRGVKLGLISLLQHVLSLPIAIIDVLAKDQSYLKLCQPNVTMEMAAVAAFVTAYTAWYHLMWALSGYTLFPYPFLYELDTFLRRLTFSASIFIFLAIILFGVLLLP